MNPRKTNLPLVAALFLLVVGFLACFFSQKTKEQTEKTASHSGNNVSGNPSFPTRGPSQIEESSNDSPLPQEFTIAEPPSQLRRGANHRLILDEAVTHERTADASIISPEVVFRHPKNQDFGPLTLNKDTYSAIEVDADFASVDRFLASEAGTLVIPVTQDLEVPVHVSQVVSRGELTTTLIGKVVDAPLSDALLVFHDGAVSGIISYYDTNTHYQFGSAGNGSVAIRNLIPDNGEPDCLNCQTPDGRGGFFADSEDPSEGEVTFADPGEVAFAVPAGRTAWDSVVGYSSEARIAGGGTSAIEAAIIASVDRMNVTLTASGAGSWFCSLVAMVEDPDASFTENDIVEVIRELRNLNDGSLDSVTDLAAELGADQVTFLIRDVISNDRGGTSGGVATIGGDASVVAQNRLNSDRRTFSHEMGHNLGFFHAWGQDGTQSSARNAKNVSTFGWRFRSEVGNTRYRTIMAGGENWGGARIGHFSNPAVLFAGTPTGAVDGFDATDTSANPRWDQDLVSGGSAGQLDLGAAYDGTNANLGANNASFAENTGGSVLANRDTRTALAVIEPVDRAVFLGADTTTIFWYGGDHTDSVDLTLLKGGVVQSSIASDIVGARRFFDWTVPNLPSGSDYQIRVTLNGNTSAESGNFTVGEALAPPPLADWNFDNVSSRGSNVPDESGNGFNGTRSNATPVSGLVGNALDFNGSTSTVSLPQAAFSSIDDEITVAMWVFGAANQPRRDSVFYALNDGGIRTLNVHLPWDTGEIFWDAGASGNNFDRISFLNDAPDASSQYRGRWNHWVFTKNTGGSGDMKIFLNGSLWHSGTGNTRSMAGITSANIGSQNVNTTNQVPNLSLLGNDR